jgi:hypothetical protein
LRCKFFSTYFFKGAIVGKTFELFSWQLWPPTIRDCCAHFQSLPYLATIKIYSIQTIFSSFLNLNSRWVGLSWLSERKRRRSSGDVAKPRPSLVFAAPNSASLLSGNAAWLRRDHSFRRLMKFLRRARLVFKYSQCWK